MKSVKLSIVSLTFGLEGRGSVLAYVQKLSLALYGSLLPPSCRLVLWMVVVVSSPLLGLRESGCWSLGEWDEDVWLWRSSLLVEVEEVVFEE